MSNEFTEFLRECGIQHRTLPPLWPQANGEVERQNRSILKALGVANAEGKKWTEELPKFQLACRSTSHTSTGVAPALLTFGRNIRSKLPELRPDKSVGNEGIRNRNWGYKLTEKACVDNKQGAIPSSVLPGDQVLLKNTKTNGKLAPNFEQEPYTVLAKEEHEVTVESKDGVVYKRDSSFVKPFCTPDKAEQHTIPEGVCIKSTGTSDLAADDSVSLRRKRAVKRPERLKDYILWKP